MTPTKPDRSESRRSSILKPHKPRQPLQNVNLNSSFNERTFRKNENSPATSKVTRRVSFAEKKHIKEFCHSTQGTVWDSTYEEHDSSLKGSFAIDQTVMNESKEDASKCTTESSCTYIETRSNYEARSNIVDNVKLCEFIAGTSKDDIDMDCNLDLTDAAMGSLVERTALPIAVNDAIFDVVTVYRDTDEKYADSNEHYAVAPCTENDVCSDGRTCVQNQSMEFTMAIPVPLLSQDMKENKQNDIKIGNNEVHKSNLCADYATDYHNVSMEITQAVPIAIKPARFDMDILKRVPAIVQNCEKHEAAMLSLREMQTNTARDQTQNMDCDNNDSIELTALLHSSLANAGACHTDYSVNNAATNISMEMTAAISATHERSTMHSCNELQKVQNITCEDKTEFFHGTSMEITRPVNMLLCPSIYDEKNTRIGEPTSTDGITLIRDVSMEMTKVVALKDGQEIAGPTVCEPSSQKEVISEGRNACKSVFVGERLDSVPRCSDITVPEPILSPHERTHYFAARSAETSLFGAMSTTRLLMERSAGSTLEPDVTANDSKAIHGVSIEITAAVPPTSHQDVVTNERNSIAFEDNAMLNTTRSKYPAVFTKNVVGKDLTLSREIVEATSVDQSEVTTDHKLLENLDHFSSALLNNVKERTFRESEDTNMKEAFDSPTESRIFKESNAHLSFDDRVNDERSENKMYPGSMRMSELNFSGTPDNVDFLRKSLQCSEDNIRELSSISAPSFVDIEEDSVFESLHEDATRASIVTGAASVDDKKNTTVKNHSQSMNADRMKDWHASIVKDNMENNRKVDNRAVAKTVINDNRTEESNRYVTDMEHLCEENVLPISSCNCKKTETIPFNTIHFGNTEVISEDRIDKKNFIREGRNDDAKMQDVDETERYSEVEKEKKVQKLSQYIGCFLKTLEDPVNRESSNNKANVQGTEQRERHSDVEDRFKMEQCIDAIGSNESLIKQDPFSLLAQTLEIHGERDDCIWNVYDKNIDKKLIAFGFISNSLMIVVFSSISLNTQEIFIDTIKVVSRLADDADILVKIVHGLILEKINGELLTNLYKNHKDFLPMLDFVTQDVKLAIDFMYDLKRLDSLNLMEIARNEISFMSISKNLDIMLNIKISVKRFDKLSPNDIRIFYILGKNKINEADVKSLIVNVKKDHKFLRRYMDDVQVYIDIIEETSPKEN